MLHAACMHFEAHSIGSSQMADISAGTYDADDVAGLLKSSTRHIRRLADGGWMPSPFRIGRLVRWQKSAIDTWISEGCPRVKASKKGR